MPSKKQDFTELQVLFEHYVDAAQRTIYLDDELHETSVGNAIRALTYLDSRSAEPIKIHLSTFGGSVYDGLGLYNHIKACKSPVIITAHSKIMSMGTVVICAADLRIAHPDTSFMIHEPSDWVGGQLEDIKIAAREVERLSNRIIDIFVNKTNKKDRGYWTNLKKDTYFSAQEALKLGLIDEIL